jgi:hypothetical protein
MANVAACAQATFFWELTLGARRLLVAAAALQRGVGDGCFQDDIAVHLSVDVETVARYDQELKQAVRAWRLDVGTEPPLQLPANVCRTDRGPAKTVYFLPEPILHDVERLVS